MKRLAAVVALLALMLATASQRPVPSQANAVEVCQAPGCPFNTIQAAVDATCAEGGVISVKPGIYDENLDIACPPEAPAGLTILGSGPGGTGDGPPPFDASAASRKATVLDGGCNGLPTVTISHSTVTLAGLQLTDGCIDVVHAGANLQVDGHSSVRLSNGVVSWGQADAPCTTYPRSDAGGIRVGRTSSLRLESTQVTQNTNLGCGAGGIFNDSDGFVPLSDPSASPDEPSARPFAHALRRLPRPAPGTQTAGEMPSKPVGRDQTAAPAPNLPAAPAPGGGAGVYAAGSSISDNYAAHGAGGIANHRGVVILDHTRIASNDGGIAGGVANGADGPITTSLNGGEVRGNHARGNYGLEPNEGAGGVYPATFGSFALVLRGERVQFNTVDTGLQYFAGGVAVEGGDLRPPPQVTGGTRIVFNTPPQCAVFGASPPVGCWESSSRQGDKTDSPGPP